MASVASSAREQEILGFFQPIVPQIGDSGLGRIEATTPKR
jgi:hypothetical protein